MSRRAGQIKKRGERKWSVSVFLGRTDGKRQYRAKTIHGSKKEADRALREMLSQRDLGITVVPARMSLGEYLDHWLEAAAKPRVSPRTLQEYKWHLKAYVRPDLGPRRLDQLRPLEIQALYSAMTERGLTGRTVHVTNNVLRSALKQAVRWQMLARNPAADVDLPRWEKREMRALSAEEAERFRKACAASPHGLLFTFLLATGMRPAEACGIRWRDCDLERGEARVTQALVRLKGGVWEMRPPKTAKSRRAIPLPAQLVRELREHRARQAKRRLLKGPAWEDHDLVFAGRRGQPLDAHNLSTRAFKKVLTEAGLPASIRLYDLRHSTASLLLLAGEHPKVVADRARPLDHHAHPGHLLPRAPGDAGAGHGEARGAPLREACLTLANHWQTSGQPAARQSQRP